MKSTLETAIPSDGMWLPGRAALATEPSGAPGENVAPRTAISPRGASQQDLWRTTCEVAINPVSSNRRKDSCRCWKRQGTPEPKWHAARRDHSVIAPSSLVARPGDSHRLKVQLNACREKPVKPVVPCLNWGSIQSTSNGEDTAGKGRRSKRKPLCSGADRAAPAIKARRYPPRKGADFRWALAGGKTL